MEATPAARSSEGAADVCAAQYRSTSPRSRGTSVSDGGDGEEPFADGGYELVDVRPDERPDRARADGETAVAAVPPATGIATVQCVHDDMTQRVPGVAGAGAGTATADAGRAVGPLSSETVASVGHCRKASLPPTAVVAGLQMQGVSYDDVVCGCDAVAASCSSSGGEVARVLQSQWGAAGAATALTAVVVRFANDGTAAGKTALGSALRAVQALGA